jgi:hypothetical protein
MDKFFETMRNHIAPDGSLRMVINRTNDEMMVTVELKTEDKGWTSPIFGRGHFSVLDQNFFKDLEKGVTEVKPYLVNTKSMADSVKTAKETPKTTEKPVTGKLAGKPEKTKEIAPKATEPIKQDMFTAPVEELMESEELQEEELQEDLVKVDENTGEVIDTEPEFVEEEVSKKIEPDPLTPSKETGMETAKVFFQEKKYQESVDTLNQLLVFYPNDEEIKGKIAKISLKLPVKPVEDDF